jgi:fumarate hydratase class II
MQSFERHCVQGISANRERISDLMARSLMLVTALVPHIGYDKAAEIAKRASHENTSLKQAALALGYVTAEDYERWVVPASMIRPSA